MINKIVRFIKEFRYSIAGTAVIFFVLILPSPYFGRETGFIGRYGIDKLFHLVMFFALSLIQISENQHGSSSKDRKLNLWVLVVWGIALACFTEVYQAFAGNGRQGSIFDLAADVTGILVANLINFTAMKKFLRNRYHRN